MKYKIKKKKKNRTPAALLFVSLKSKDTHVFKYNKVFEKKKKYHTVLHHLSRL